MQPQEILKKYFGYDSFRHRQREAVDNILSGRDVLCIMPTGAGKSLCYQVPAMAMDGVSIVVSPLISLMKDQVMSLNKNGIPAAYLNSSLTVNQYLKALDYMKRGRYKVVYVAPERLLTSSFLSACREINISMVAVDEAHCVSRWGQDFRPGYLKIPQFISLLKNRPVLAAFTATATGRVKEDICRLLELDEPYCVTTGFDRPNLSFSVIRPKDKYRALLNIIKNHREDSGIVYCSTRNRVDTLYDNLSAAGYSCGKYHAGLSADERKSFQDRFIFDENKIMIATNAFGMGIDKSNVGYVVHYNMPKNIESYYQEAGRAGRDGQKAECVLLYAPKDVITNKFLIENSQPNEELTIQQRRQVRERELEKLKYMTFYCTTDRCLRQFILEYFGQKSDGYCGNCSNCLAEFEQEDITGRARKAIMCISQLPVSFGLSVVADVLKGTESEMVEKWHLNRNDYFGSMAGLSLAKIKDILRYLINRGYMDQSADKYPTVNVTARGERLMTEDTKVMMKVKKSEKTAPLAPAPMPEADRGLLAKLKALRLDIAKRERVPAYVIFTDATLNEMSARKPKTLQEMAQIKGVGSRKLSAYGEKFLRLINEKTGII